MKFRYSILMVFLVMLLPMWSSSALSDIHPEKQSGVEGKAVAVFGGIVGKGGRYAEMDWEKLMPPDWNPAEVFDDLNLDELDDDDPRVEEAMERLRKMWDEAPINPDLQGKAIKISGFVASLDFTGRAELKEFLLVPYFGACIHLPPPPANQIVHVILEKPRRGIRAMDEVTVYGKLAIETHENELGRSGYSMTANAIEPYVEKKK